MRVHNLVGIGLISAAAAALTACGDGGPNCVQVAIAILSPSSGGEIRLADDTSTADGVQIEVRARVDGIEPGGTATLTVNGTAFDTPATVDANNTVRFSDVTVPQGNVELTVSATNECDDEGSDTIGVFVVGDLQCELSVLNPTLEVPAYPQPVLNGAADDNAATPGFQATIQVATTAGYDVELFVLDVGAASESSGGVVTADSDGVAEFAELTIAEDVQALRAQCASPTGGSSGAAPSQAFFVDSVAPDCTITSPADSATIIPDDDEDPGTDDTQITLAASVTGGDTVGEPAEFMVNALAIAGSDVASNGDTSAVATLSSPGDKTVTVSGQDHALNTCSDSIDITYETDGCSIVITAPTGTVAVDADPGTPGFQVDIETTIDTACIGRTATTTCESGGLSTASVTVASDGSADFRITACAADNCEVSYDCSVSVTNTAGITTSEGLTVSTDNLGPGVTFTATGAGGTIPCGSVVGPEVDRDATLSGVQIDTLVLSQPGATRTLTQNGSPVTLSGGGTARVTLADGANNFAAQACDALSNCSNTACTITRADLSIAFSPPFVNDAVLGADHGTVGVGTLTVDVCGTVGSASASVDITITPTIAGGDGAATVTGMTWCRNGVVFPEGGPYTIQADGTDGADMGSVMVSGIIIDITGPGAPADLDAAVLDREAAQITWTAPSDGGAPVDDYDVRMSTSPIDAGNFASATPLAPPIPSAPGMTEVVTAAQLRPGTDYYFAVVALDPVGNPSSLATIGPLSPPVDFDRSGTIAPPVIATLQRFGESGAAGDFNADGFDDLAVGAPRAASNAGEVYVFLGGPSGIGDTPDVTFTTATTGGFLGQSLAKLDWNGDGDDDLAIGAPFQNGFQGAVVIFYGGSDSLFNPATPGARTQSNADVAIAPSADLGAAVIGISLASLNFNNDSRDDLAIGASGSFGNNGMVVMLLGGATPATITIDDADAAPLNGVTAWRIRGGTAAPSGCFLGNGVHNVGRIRGAAAPDAIAFTGNASCAGGERTFVIAGRTSAPAGGYAALPFNAALDLHTSNGQNSTGFGTSIGSIATASGRSLFIAAHSESGGRMYVLPGTTVGGSATPVSVSTIATATLTNSAESTFGLRALANGATSFGADIDADGNEDLVITSADESPTAYVFYGPPAFSGSVDIATTADHTVPRPPGVFNGADVRMNWGGDYNADGLEDLVWRAAGSRPAPGSTTSGVGLIEVLY